VNVRECFEKGLLVKARVSKETVKSTVNLAKHYIERASGNLKIEYFDVAFTLAYQAMLHTARALVFKEGVKERSHVCVVLYLKEKYQENPRVIKYVNILDSYRISRHEVVYRGGYVSKEEASGAIEDAKDFLRVANGFLGFRYRTTNFGLIVAHHNHSSRFLETF
jgi:uncharacterized protein (UPF0332 family)